jgi:hypothetical protein
MKNNFSTEDKQKVVEFLNFVAKNARFDVNTQEIIDYFKSLSYMQQTLLPKIEMNILEITKVVEAPLEEMKKEKITKSK